MLVRLARDIVKLGLRGWRVSAAFIFNALTGNAVVRIEAATRETLTMAQESRRLLRSLHDGLKDETLAVHLLARLSEEDAARRAQGSEEDDLRAIAEENRRLLRGLHDLLKDETLAVHLLARLSEQETAHQPPQDAEHIPQLDGPERASEPELADHHRSPDILR